ncbi:putative hydrolase [Oscillibacter valericigenes Sjm18-20]|nr:putative hydrolase [Oscillibacter valericigenes Sjm18-20]
MNATAYPGYEYHLNLYQIIAHGTEDERAAATAAQRQYISGYTKPDDMKIVDIKIPGGDKQPMTLRIYTPGKLPKNAPIVMEIHGGGFVGGNLDIDNYRCITIAAGTPAIVVGVDYRLSVQGGVRFPQPLMDCYTALEWIHTHAEEFGGDPERIALHGTSAGGCLCAGLALYARDHNGPKLSLVILNCPVLSLENSYSKHQFSQFALSREKKYNSAEAIYLGGYDGSQPSYYAFPAYCRDLEDLPPHYIIVGEYDTLRDDGLEYATRLLHSGIPCELQVAPRVGHGFCVVDHPLTHWVHKGVCASLRREFCMDITEF